MWRRIGRGVEVRHCMRKEHQRLLRIIIDRPLLTGGQLSKVEGTNRSGTYRKLAELVRIGAVRRIEARYPFYQATQAGVMYLEEFYSD